MRAPTGFVYSVKANRYLTYIEHLKDVTELLERFPPRAYDGSD
jgi:uncharacterized protein YecE (DUF72 family)